MAADHTTSSTRDGIPIYQVDAFVEEGVPGGPGTFSGNPAAVCILDTWLDDATMQAIAAENNLSETAFVVPAPDAGAEADFELRWFTPTVEVDLCGHATLATAYVLFEHVLDQPRPITFHTRSGPLQLSRDDDAKVVMDLPTDRRTVAEPSPEVMRVLGEEVETWLDGSTWIAVLGSPAAVERAVPDLLALGELEVPYLSITAAGDPGGGVDFVSRFFAPGAGIGEDPVTGSAHCALAPYWAQRLGRTGLVARQLSARGGLLDCEVLGDLVRLRGRCAPYLSGTLQF